MRMLILDGAGAGDVMSDRIAAALGAGDAERVVLRDQKIGNCAGDFFCWIRSPGVCTVDDGNRTIANHVVHSDLVVLLTPVTFGGYSSALKRAVDHLIQNLSPFFTRVDGQTHHRRRYRAYPDLLIIGWLPSANAGAAATFRHLAHRNAINMYAGTCVSDVLVGALSDAEMASRCEAWLAALAARRSTSAPALPPLATSGSTASVPVRRALLLVGSPRTATSTSHSLGSYLMARMAAAGVATEKLFMYTSMGSARRREKSLPTVDAADLVVLAFPLYVDSLPGPITAALEHIAARNHGASGRGLMAIANCGFPEPAHAATSLAICAEFARHTGLDWRGGLAFGAGESVHGADLEALGGRTAAIRGALDLAAVQLAAGRPVPQAAVDQFDRPPVPPWLYRLLGGFGWRQQARHYGMARELARRPYESVGS